MKFLEKFLLTLIIILGLVVICHTCFYFFPNKIFVKIYITFAVVFFTILSTLLIKRHLLEKAILKKGNFIG